MKFIYWILFLSLTSCNRKQHADEFHRFVIATTYANNMRTPDDSTEITSTICERLIYFDTRQNCFLCENKIDGLHFFKVKIDKPENDSLISFISDLRKRFPNEWNIKGHCAPDISIIMENDTLTDYHFIGNWKETDMLKLLHLFDDKQKVQTDTIELLMKYKYYITSKISLMGEKEYGFRAASYKYQKNNNFPRQPDLDALMK